jgi:hypothetical protein
MAVIQIPMGGRMVGIDIPDFAFESTQQDILNYAKDQANSLQVIAAAMSGQTQSLNTIANRIGSGGGSGGSGGGPGGGGGGSGRGSSRNRNNNPVTSAFNALAALEPKVSNMAESLLAGLRLPAMGAAVGTVVGIFEEFGNSMSNFSRIGAGIGVNFIELRNGAAEVGLGLDQLGKISAESGATLGSLGKNTAEGVNRLLSFTKALKTATADAGFFGLSSAEMAQFTVDELELRRQMYDTEYNRNLNEQDLAVQMKENLKLQSAMASLTGQDVRQRIKAQQDFQRDAVNASILATLTEDQQKAVKAAASGFSQLGSAGEIVADAFRNQLAGLPAENAKGYAELQAVLSSAGVDIGDTLRQMTNGVADGMNEETMSAASNALASSIKNIPVDQLKNLNILALAGVEGANLALTARVETVASGAESLAESTVEVDKALDKLTTAIADGTMKIIGTTANLETFAAGTKADLMNGILAGLGINAENVGEAQKGMAELAESLSKLPDSDMFEKFVNALAAAVIVGTGARAVFSMGGIGGPTNAVQQANDAAAIAGAVGTAAGVQGSEKLMKGVQIEAGATALASIFGAAAGVDFTQLNTDLTNTSDGFETLNDTVGTLIETIRSKLLLLQGVGGGNN